MYFGVFMHKDGPIYNDVPEVHYHFRRSTSAAPSRWSVTGASIGGAVKLPQSKGSFAVRRLTGSFPSGRIRLLPGDYREGQLSAILADGSAQGRW